MDVGNDPLPGSFGQLARAENTMSQTKSDTPVYRLREDPLSLACLAGVGVSVLLMSLTLWLA